MSVATITPCKWCKLSMDKRGELCNIHRGDGRSHRAWGSRNKFVRKVKK